MSSKDNIEYNDFKGKEARGLNDDDLGEVQEVRDDIVITKAGIIDKKIYKIPKNLIERFDGQNLIFKITKDEAKRQFETDL